MYQQRTQLISIRFEICKQRGGIYQWNTLKLKTTKQMHTHLYKEKHNILQLTHTYQVEL